MPKKCCNNCYWFQECYIYKRIKDHYDSDLFWCCNYHNTNEPEQPEPLYQAVDASTIMSADCPFCHTRNTVMMRGKDTTPDSRCEHFDLYHVDYKRILFKRKQGTR